MSDLRHYARRALGSVRVRVTLTAMVAFGLAFALAAIVLVKQVRHSLEDDVRQESRVLVSNAASTLRAGGEPESIFTSPGAVYGAVIDSNGDIVYRTGTFPPGNAVVTYESVPVAGRAFTVAIASPLDGVRRSVDTIAQGLWLVTPALVALVGFLAWIIAGRALRPVEAIRREVDEITHTTMHRRVPVPTSSDEVQLLAATMNGMLDRLEGASARQREFVSDASHELRSPIAAVRTELEVALRTAEPDEWEAVAQRVLGENQRLGALVDDLLELARLDERPNGDLVEVDLDDLVRADSARRNGGLTIETGGVYPARVFGNVRQLGAVVRNLVDNACRHATARVAIATDLDGDEVVLRVDDDGPGIPLEHREHVFRRFARLDDGRARDAGGAGLGLALVHRVVDAHAGAVRVDVSPWGGARFEVRLPGHRDAAVGALDLAGDEAGRL